MKRGGKRNGNPVSAVVSLFAKDFGLKCLSLLLATGIYFALSTDSERQGGEGGGRTVAAKIVEAAEHSADRVLAPARRERQSGKKANAGTAGAAEEGTEVQLGE